MIEKINLLKTKTNSEQVKALCESTINTLTSTIYNNVTPEAKYQIEKVTLEDLFEKLSKTKDKEAREWVKNQKRLYTLNNLGVRDSINALSNQENKGISQILEKYKDYIDNDVSEVLLYEQFTTALQSFSYFPQVGNAIQDIKNRVENYKTDVDIVKILETMKTTKSNYLVPLIEDVVNNYLANKNEQTKSQLKETLIKFTYDPFVRDIVSLVSLDAKDLQLEYANGECDIEKIYSPVMYIGENEAIFNVKGSFYIKKGNNINKLKEEYKSKLDKEFVSLCETINDSNVYITDNNIKYYYGKNDKAVISPEEIIINNYKYSQEQFNNTFESTQWAGNQKSDFYRTIKTLNENFENIAEINFVKRVYLKENEDYSADVFKLRDNVFITITNPEMGKRTFYRNINPIQAKNIMMEHLRFDISKTFRSLLPDEDKIISSINETKKDYNEYIENLEQKINEFATSAYGKEINEQVVEALQDELKEVKEEYKDYLNRVESYTRPSADINENISVTIDVHGKKYTVPIPDEAVQDLKDDEGKEEAGTEVGGEDVEDKPADAVTFDDEDTQLLGDAPSIDLGADEIEADADAEEAEIKRDKGEQEEEAEDYEEEEEADVDDEEDKKKKDEDEEEDVEESAEEPSVNQDLTEKPKKRSRKVFLKKRK